MYEVTIITPKSERERVIEELKHFMQLDNFEVEETRKLYPDPQKIEDTLSKLESLVGVLNPEGKTKKSPSPILEAEEVATEVEFKLENINKMKNETEQKLKKLQSMIELIDTERFIGKVTLFSEKQDNWGTLAEELEKKNASIIATRVFEDEIIVLAKGIERGFVGNYNRIRRELVNGTRKRKHELDRFDGEKRKISNVFGARINTLKKQVEVELKVLREKRKLTHSELFTFIKGWVPESSVEKIKSIEDAVVLLEDAGQDAPTKLDNPWFFKPFENFMYIFALPKYGEFDPTPFISIFFPLFYGVMMSDVVYGVLLLMLSLAIRRKYRLFSELLIAPAVAAIFFGVIFDSYLGFSIGKVLINPIQRPFQLLYYAIVVGVFYVDLGLVMGITQNLLNDNYFEALTQQISLLAFQFGLALLFFHVQGGAVLMLVSLGLKVWADNVRGFIELPGFMSSIISFSRLAALALAGVWIAFTINFLSGLMIKIHYLAIVPAAIFFIMGHLFNFSFSVFGSFIQALRLHYVELFGLFFSAKGKPFTPLGE